MSRTNEKVFTFPADFVQQVKELFPKAENERLHKLLDGNHLYPIGEFLQGKMGAANNISREEVLKVLNKGLDGNRRALIKLRNTLNTDVERAQKIRALYDRCMQLSDEWNDPDA